MITIEIKAENAEELQHHVLTLAKVMGQNVSSPEVKEEPTTPLVVEPPSIATQASIASPEVAEPPTKRKPGRPALQKKSSPEPLVNHQEAEPEVHQPVSPAPEEPSVTREQALAVLKQMINKFGAEPGGKGILMGRELMDLFKVNKFIEIPLSELGRFHTECLARLKD